MHVIGLSSQAAGHKALVPEIVRCLKEADASHITVIVGGVIPQKDYDFLYEHGVSCIFGPGTKIPDAAHEILRTIRKNVQFSA